MRITHHNWIGMPEQPHGLHCEYECGTVYREDNGPETPGRTDHCDISLQRSHDPDDAGYEVYIRGMNVGRAVYEDGTWQLCYSDEHRGRHEPSAETVQAFVDAIAEDWHLD